MSIDLHQIAIARHNLEFIIGKTALSTDKLALKIVKGINQHTKVEFSLAITEKKASGSKSLQEQMEALFDETTLEIRLVNLPGTKTSDPAVSLFIGTIGLLNLDVVQGTYTISGEAFSFTYLMDKDKQRRAFQDKSLPYNTLLNQVIQMYGSAVLHSQLTEKQLLDEIAFQMDETDWEFLVRMASRLNLGLVPCESNNTQWVNFGMPESTKTYTLDASCHQNYQVIRKRQSYQKMLENEEFAKEAELDFLSYQINAIRQYLTIGDYVDFSVSGMPEPKSSDGKKQSLIVTGAEAVLEQTEFRFSYCLSHAIGTQQPKQLNPQLSGITLDAEVLKVEGDKVKVWFNGLESKPNVDKLPLFPYATGYSAESNTGWYVMPEVGDTVKVLFPSCREKEAVVTGSIRSRATAQTVLPKDQEKEKEKYHFKHLRTAQGKEIQFTNQEIVLAGYGASDGQNSVVSIKLNETSGIEIDSTNSNITIYSQGTLNVESAQDLVINAGNTLKIYCKTNSIEMAGETTVKGPSNLT